MIKASYKSTNLWVKIVDYAHAKPYSIYMDDISKYFLDNK